MRESKKGDILQQFGFSDGFFCVVLMLFLQNTLIGTDFNVLKNLKKIFKTPISVYFRCSAEDSTKNPAENLDSILQATESSFFSKEKGKALEYRLPLE